MRAYAGRGVWVVCLAWMLGSACADDDTNAGETTATMSKDEVRALLSEQGEQSSRDWCEELEWYGDGICDPFCLQPDPDCENREDPCETLGWYDDGICDWFCSNPDPDCTANSGCTNNSECGAAEYCAQTSCGADGACEPRPEACTLEYAPVCGCDGQTHGNACGAASAGTSVASEGECGGGSEGCADNSECGEGDYCVLTSCGMDGVAGSCAPRPEVCTQEYAPVCSCSGQTYGNACEAAGAGANVAVSGECGGISQGCASNANCDADAYCLLTSCGADGGFGVCTERPQGCDLDYAPVCGCNGETYGNACGAAGAGVNVASEGECGDTPEGCLDNSECGAAEYCALTSCGADDAPGSCEPRPEACTQEYAPVCGCNGETYGNACGAAGAGENVASEGECEDMPEGCLDNSECGAAEYCALTSCGADDALGACEPRPEACDQEYVPVCGCNGETYGNACGAAGAGVNVASEGECL